MRVRCPKCKEMIDVPSDGPDPELNDATIDFARRVQERLVTVCAADQYGQHEAPRAGDGRG